MRNLTLLLLTFVAPRRRGWQRIALIIDLARSNRFGAALRFGLLLIIRVVDLVVRYLFVPHVAGITALHLSK